MQTEQRIEKALTLQYGQRRGHTAVKHAKVLPSKMPMNVHIPQAIHTELKQFLTVYTVYKD